MSPSSAVGVVPQRVVYLLQRAFVAVEARKAELLAEVDLVPSHQSLMMNVLA